MSRFVTCTIALQLVHLSRQPIRQRQHRLRRAPRWRNRLRCGVLLEVALHRLHIHRVVVFGQQGLHHGLDLAGADLGFPAFDNHFAADPGEGVEPRLPPGQPKNSNQDTISSWKSLT
jgi:hypothetical protein